MFSMKLFDDYFQSITKNLDLFEWPEDPKVNIFDEIDIIISKFWSHPKIIELKQKIFIKKQLHLNSIQKNSLKASLMIYHGMKQLVVICHLISSLIHLNSRI